MSPQIHLVSVARLGPSRNGLHTLTYRYAPDGQDHTLHGVHIEPELEAVFTANDVRLFCLARLHENGLARALLSHQPNFLVSAVTTGDNTATQALPRSFRIAKGACFLLAALSAALLGVFARGGQAWPASAATTLALTAGWAAWRIPSMVGRENLELNFCDGTMAPPQAAQEHDAELARSSSTLVLADEACHGQGRHIQEQ